GYGEIWRQNAGGQWLSDLIVTAPDAATGDQFGTAAAVNANTAAFGAPHAHNGALANAGAVYIYRYVNGSWLSDGKITPPDPTAGAEFGHAVSISGDRIAVAASGARKTYLFRRIGTQQWIQDSRMNDPAGPDYYGADIAIDGNAMITSDPGDDTGGKTDGGVGYIYQIGAQEPSDTAEGAVPITDGTYTGCTINATTDGYSTCSLQPPDGADGWYVFTATKTGTATLSTQGSNFDTTLSVHSGVPSTLANTLACNDDFAPPQRYSRVTLPVTDGQRYYVR